MHSVSNSTRLLLSLSTWPALAVFVLMAFSVDAALWIGGGSLPYPTRVLIEAAFLLHLLAAWNYQGHQSVRKILYPLLALFLIRILYYSPDSSSVFWGLRAFAAETLLLRFLGYLVGVLLLHPFFYLFLQGNINSKTFSSVQIKWLAVVVGLVAAGVLFTTLGSVNISRDGRDWIQRAELPVWHLYLREPLTIGLYRVVTLAASQIGLFTSREVIAGLSTVAGVWSLFWFGIWTRERTFVPFCRCLAYLLLLASGGLIVLFFGHVEVYGILVAGLLPAFYFAQRYLDNKSGIVWAATAHAVALALHLSAGWLMPAFLLIPLLKKDRANMWKDIFLFASIFLLLQTGFWLFVIFHGYGGSVAEFLKRLIHDFNVGPDQAMFLPSQAVWHPQHLWDLFNEYLYLSLPCLLLTPVALLQLKQRFSGDTFFYLMAFAGYLLYSILWNPDRGFPEDWDIFSPLVLLAVFLFVHLMLSQESETVQPNKEANAEVVYILSLGCLPFALAQVWYHHTVFFSFMTI